ncbi:hypothetical protein TIFTF001_051485, partial [Ficus carica]
MAVKLFGRPLAPHVAVPPSHRPPPPSRSCQPRSGSRLVSPPKPRVSPHRPSLTSPSLTLSSPPPKHRLRRKAPTRAGWWSNDKGCRHLCETQMGRGGVRRRHGGVGGAGGREEGGALELGVKTEAWRKGGCLVMAHRLRGWGRLVMVRRRRAGFVVLWCWVNVKGSGDWVFGWRGE